MSQAAAITMKPMPMHDVAQPITPTIVQRIWKFNALTDSLRR